MSGAFVCFCGCVCVCIFFSFSLSLSLSFSLSLSLPLSLFLSFPLSLSLSLSRLSLASWRLNCWRWVGVVGLCRVRCCGRGRLCLRAAVGLAVLFVFSRCCGGVVWFGCFPSSPLFLWSLSGCGRGGCGSRGCCCGCRFFFNVLCLFVFFFAFCFRLVLVVVGPVCLVFSSGWCGLCLGRGRRVASLSVSSLRWLLLAPLLSWLSVVLVAVVVLLWSLSLWSSLSASLAALSCICFFCCGFVFGAVGLVWWGRWGVFAVVVLGALPVLSGCDRCYCLSHYCVVFVVVAAAFVVGVAFVVVVGVAVVMAVVVVVAVVVGCVLWAEMGLGAGSRLLPFPFPWVCLWWLGVWVSVSRARSLSPARVSGECGPRVFVVAFVSCCPCRRLCVGLSVLLYGVLGFLCFFLIYACSGIYA